MNTPVIAAIIILLISFISFLSIIGTIAYVVMTQKSEEEEEINQDQQNGISGSADFAATEPDLPPITVDNNVQPDILPPPQPTDNLVRYGDKVLIYNYHSTLGTGYLSPVPTNIVEPCDKPNLVAHPTNKQIWEITGGNPGTPLNYGNQVIIKLPDSNDYIDLCGALTGGTCNNNLALSDTERRWEITGQSRGNPVVYGRGLKLRYSSNHMEICNTMEQNGETVLQVGSSPGSTRNGFWRFLRP